MKNSFSNTVHTVVRTVVATVLVTASAISVSEVNSTLSAIPANTWHKVDSGGLAQTSGIAGDPGGILEFSGMAYDTVNRQLLVFGGGHNNYSGNEIWAFDIATLTWNKMYEPDPAPPSDGGSSSEPSAYTDSNYDSSEPGKLQSSQRPMSRHTYDNVEFIDEAGVMVTFNGWTPDKNHGASGFSKGMIFPPDTWTYDFAANEWAYKSNTPIPFKDAGCAAYDTNAKLLVAVAWARTWVYDINNDQWTERNPAQAPVNAIETVCEYDSKRNVIYFFGGEWGPDGNSNELWKYDAASNVWEKLSPTGVLPPKKGGYGMAYDRANDKIIVFRGNGTGTWVYDPENNSWTEQQPTTGNPVQTQKRIHGNLKYDPVNNVTFLVTHNNGTIDTWAYRYGAGVVDSTGPTTPLNVTASVTGKEAITLSWTAAEDAESGITSYNVYRDDAVVGSTGGTSYTDSGLQELTTYSYRISAVNGAGLEGAKSGAVTATTEGDNVPPVLDSVSAGGDATVVEVVYSEAVTEASAENSLNYTITPTVSVLAAQLSADNTVVTLTTGELSEGVDYTLTVNSVRDEASVPNTIAANSQLSFSYASTLNISNTLPERYQWDVMAAGNAVYIDRDYTYTTIPSSYLSLNYLRTANDDKNATAADFVSFDVNQSVTVYVGYDDRNVSRPSWLQDWTDTGEALLSNDQGASLQLYAKDYEAGTVTLGGNQAENSMYVVVVKAKDVGTGGDTPPSDGDTPTPPPGSDTPPSDGNGGDGNNGDGGDGNTDGDAVGGVDIPGTADEIAAGSLNLIWLVLFALVQLVRLKRSSI